MRLSGLTVTSILTTLITTSISTAVAFPPSEKLRIHERQAEFLAGANGDATSATAFVEPNYLPIQIGGILGSYAITLVIVFAILLALNKQRKERLRGADEINEWTEPRFEFPAPAPFVGQDTIGDQLAQYPSDISLQKGHTRNFSLPSPTSIGYHPSYENYPVYENPSVVFSSPPQSVAGHPGVAPEVDQSIVERDRIMAQNQLEDMYKHVMEQEDAKEQGFRYQPQHGSTGLVQSEYAPSFHSRGPSMASRKERAVPASLNLAAQPAADKKESRTSSFMTALKSPLMRTKKTQAVSISSPIMTPMSGTFPTQIHSGEEMMPMSPRHYIPAMSLPPIPSKREPSYASSHASLAPRRLQAAPITPPDISPESTQSIDERLKGMSMQNQPQVVITEQVAEEEDEEKEAERRAEEEYQQRLFQQQRQEEQQQQQPYEQRPLAHDRIHTRHLSNATIEPQSAISTHSQVPLMGLPTSPKPGARFPSMTSLPSLPSSPKPGATFGSIANQSTPSISSTITRSKAPPSAVRTGGTLPLRAYEPALMSPTTFERSVKQTTFERAGPMSPGGMNTARTPGTGMAVPYTPYQPFSPVFPVTPSLVTKADRKRMRRFEPKTPTLHMVSNEDDVW